MPRKPKKKTFNFNLSCQGSSQENIQENSPNQDSRTLPSQETLPSARPPRAAKVRCIQNLSEIISEERCHDLNVRKERTRLRLASESAVQYEQRLEDLRRRSSQRLSSDSIEQRKQRLEDWKRRSSERLASESVEQRKQRLEDLQRRSSEHLASESVEQRKKRLEDLQRRSSKRLASESVEQKEHRLEEQKRRDARRRTALEMNNLLTYKRAIGADVPYHTLGPFDVLCIHCGALHFPEERVSNQINRNSFGDCCLHGRILMDQPKFSNELARLFLNRHPLSEEFHRKIRNINASFALASFNVEDDRTINSHGIYSFIVCGQVYHKMNMTAHPTQNDEGVFERPLYGQLYFLDPDDAVNERVNHPINYGVSTSVIELLEYIIREQNCYVQGYAMMREIEEEMNRVTFAQGIPPPYVKLLFRVPDEADHRFNIPTCNDVCAVFTLNADQSFPDNEMVIHQRNKNIVTLKNIDK